MIKVTRSKPTRGISQSREYNFEESMNGDDFAAFEVMILSPTMYGTVNKAPITNGNEVFGSDWMPLVHYDDDQCEDVYTGYEVTVSLENQGRAVGDYRMKELDDWFDNFEELLHEKLEEGG